MDHNIRCHPNSLLIVKRQEFDDKKGLFYKRSLHFGIKSETLQNKKYAVDFHNTIIRLKRENHGDVIHDNPKHSRLTTEIEKNELAISTGNSGDNTWEEIKDLIPDVMRVLDETGRAEDFKTILSGIQTRALDKNIALQLLHDVGQYMRQSAASSAHSMRYNDISVKFWLLIQKLFHGKAVRFFRGVSYSENHDENKKQIPAMNFAVPSDTVLYIAGLQYKSDTTKPGVIFQMLRQFAECKSEKDVKLSLDGKKISIGFGKKLGEEDLGGLRKNQHWLRDRNALNTK